MEGQTAPGVDAAGELCRRLLGRGVRAARQTDRPTAFFVDLDDGETSA